MYLHQRLNEKEGAASMKKCIVIPDSFKGTMSSAEVSEIIKKQLLLHYPDCNVVAIPAADGGEGTVDCFLSCIENAHKIKVLSTNAFGEKINCYYALYNNTAIIEMAQCAGLPQAEGRLNPAITTTYGVGTIIKEAISNGCKNIILGLGGSCTNDGGTGMAAALGVTFINKRGEDFIPTGATLCDIDRIETGKAKELLKDCSFTAMCDITNPMFGKNGAAYIFAPQKGADEKMVKHLDDNLMHLSGKIKEFIGVDVSNIPGAGAAGAMGAAVVAFLNGKLQSGINTILDTVKFNTHLIGCDVVFTGEGKVDGQSIHGKVISGVSKAAQKQNIPVIIIAGSVGDGAEKTYSIGVSAIFSINQMPMEFNKAKKFSKANLAATTDSILRLYKANNW